MKVSEHASVRLAERYPDTMASSVVRGHFREFFDGEDGAKVGVIIADGTPVWAVVRDAVVVTVLTQHQATGILRRQFDGNYATAVLRGH